MSRLNLTHRTIFSLVLIVPTAVILTCSSSKRAQTDDSFGMNGVMTVDFRGGDDQVNKLLLLDDKVVAIGTASNGSDNDFAIARLNSDGSLDPSFNSTGLVLTDINSGSRDVAYTGFIQPDKKLVVVGSSTSAGVGRIAVARYNYDGTPDTDFNATGKNTLAIGGLDDEARAAKLLSSGKILIAGQAKNSSSLNMEFALIRLNSDGTLDSTSNFGGGGGYITKRIGSGDAVAIDMGVLIDGRILLAGYARTGYQNDFALARFSAEGLVDLVYGQDGLTTIDFASLIPTSIVSGGTSSTDDIVGAAKMFTDGAILAVGTSYDGTNHMLTMADYLEDGRLGDTHFGKQLNGLAFLFYPPTPDAELPTTTERAQHLYGKAVDFGVDSTIFVAGNFQSSSNNMDISISHFDTRGNPDLTFGNAGTLITDIAGRNDESNAVIVQADGKILVAGRTQTGSSWDFLIARYWP